MLKIEIPIDQVIIDPERRVALGAMPADQAVVAVKKSYSFLSKKVDVNIEDGIVVVTIPDLDPVTANQRAEKTGRKAAEAAQSGEYRKAINLYKSVLDLAPWDSNARRNMAMALLESGSPEAALDHLIDVLRQDPGDTWAHVLVANIFLKNKRNPQTAEVYYKSAIRSNPDDPFALANYAALLAQTGRTEEAQSTFRKAIVADPDYPNSYLGLALVERQDDDYVQVLSILDELFARPVSQDPRHHVIYEEARKAYRLANEALAERSYASLMSVVTDLKTAVEVRSGTPIEIVEDRTLESVDAVAELAWNHGRQAHRIKYRPARSGIVPHVISHELEHIILEDDAFKVNRSRSFATTEKTDAHVRAELADFIGKAKRQNRSDSRWESFLDTIIHGLCRQLFNCPIDMVIERRLYDRYPQLRPSQYASLARTHQLTESILKNTQISGVTPPAIFRANATMNCAYALFTDWMYQGKTAYGAAYQSTPYYANGRRLLAMVADALPNLSPGDEYALVDDYARLLKLEGWYEWLPPRTRAGAPRANIASAPPSGTATNASLLQEKSPASVMYCLDAMKMFDNMTPQDMQLVTFEAAMLGRSGLDYSSPDQKYTLRSLPGRSFSGLHLICIMHVGLKRLNPTLDPGTHIEMEYEQALKLHESRKRQGS